MRGARQQDHNALASIELSAQPLAGCGSIAIGKHGCALKNIRLLGIVGGHFPAARRETALDAGENLFVTL